MNNLTTTQIEQIAAGLAEVGWTSTLKEPDRIQMEIRVGGYFHTVWIKPNFVGIDTFAETVNLLDPHWQSALAVITRVLEGGE
jgi:hypothetical protein